MKPVWDSGVPGGVLALSAIPALAQPVISAKSGLISYVEGKVVPQRIRLWDRLPHTSPM